MNVRHLFGGMTANERRLGRFIRDGEGHPAPAAAPAAAPPAAAPAAAPEAAPAMEPVIQNTQDAWDKEYGGTVAQPSGSEEGAAAPGVSEQGANNGDEGLDDREVLRQRAESAEAELERLREQGKEPAKPETQPNANVDEDPRPNPTDYEYGEADGRYIDALSRWSARQEYKAQRERENLNNEIKTIETSWSDSVASDEIKQLYPDFDDVVTKGADEQKWDCTPLMALGIKTSPVGPHVAYELAKNPAEASRIAALHNPVEQAYEFGRLEGRVANRISGRQPEPAKLVSDAPPPPSGRARGATGGGTSDNGLSGIQDRMLKEFR